MPTTPNWQIPSKRGGLTAITITPQQVSEAGVVTDTGTAVVVTTKLTDLGHDMTPEKQEISAITSPRANHVIVSDDQSVTIGVYKVNDNTDPDPLRTLIRNYDVFQVKWTENATGTNPQVVRMYGTRGAYRGGTQGKGAMIASITFDTIDPGAADFLTVLGS